MFNIKIWSGDGEVAYSPDGYYWQVGRSVVARTFFQRFRYTLYRFPEEISRRRKWSSALKRGDCEDWEPSYHSWICGVHFVGGVV